MARNNRGWTLVVLALAAFLVTLDNTIVVVALPSIQRDLQVSLPGLEWVSTSYILAFSSLLLAGGRLADTHGRRLVLVVGLGVFTAASLLAGQSVTLPALVLARVIQGAGAALVLPATLALLTAGRTERERGAGAAVWTAALAVALALGPVLGGYLSERWSWNWIFYINVPVGIAGGVVAVLAVPESRGETAPRLDLPGLLTSAVALLAATFALIEGHDLGWGSPTIVTALTLSVLAGVAFVTVEHRSPEPMIDLGLFRQRAFSGGVTAQVLWGLGINGVFFFLSLFMQRVLGFTPTGTGLAFLPLAASIVAGTPVAPWLMARIGAARTVAAGLTLVAAGLTQLSLLRPGDGMAGLLPGLVVTGLGSALTVPLTSSVLGAVPQERAGVAGGVLSVSREASGILGIAAIGVIVTAGEQAALAAGAAPGAAFMRGYSAGLLVAAVLSLLGAAVSVATLPGLPERPGRDRDAGPSGRSGYRSFRADTHAE